MMHLPVPHKIAQNLHESNSRLISLLDQVHPNQVHPISDRTPAEARVATPHQMSGLVSELLRAAECLRALPLEKNPEVEQALNAYRVNVERLRDLLPSIHSALLRERARLEQEGTRVEAAAEWARRSRQTL
jgi:erythromycin esterase-like protein